MNNQRVVRQRDPRTTLATSQCLAATLGIVAAAWALYLGGWSFVERGRPNTGPKSDLFFLLTGILSFVVAAFAITSLVGSCLNRAPSAVMGAVIVPGFIVLCFATAIVNIVGCFVAKNEIIYRCTMNWTNGTLDSIYDWDNLPANSVPERCNSNWTRDTVVAFIAAFFIIGYSCWYASLYYSSVKVQRQVTTQQNFAMTGFTYQPEVRPPPPDYAHEYSQAAPPPLYAQGDYRQAPPPPDYTTRDDPASSPYASPLSPNATGLQSNNPFLSNADTEHGYTVPEVQGLLHSDDTRSRNKSPPPV